MPALLFGTLEYWFINNYLFFSIFSFFKVSEVHLIKTKNQYAPEDGRFAIVTVSGVEAWPTEAAGQSVQCSAKE